MINRETPEGRPALKAFLFCFGRGAIHFMSPRRRLWGVGLGNYARLPRVEIGGTVIEVIDNTEGEVTGNATGNRGWQ